MAYYGYHRISTKEQHLERGSVKIRKLNWKVFLQIR